MASQDVLVLVPGLFGFDSFGQGSDQIRYFDQVGALLCQYTGWGTSQLVVHKPAPTGALIWRVKSLYEFVTSILDNGLPGVPEVGKVHLLGHSTGGLDLRLLLNDRFCWPDPPSDAARARLKSRIGKAISLSAPHGGTPIARRLRGAMENALPLFYLLSIFGKLEVPPQTMAEVAGILSTSLLESITANTRKDFAHALARALPNSLVGDVTRFLDNVTDDHELIHDLTPIAMTRLNAAIAQGNGFPILSYVTVSPPVSLRRWFWKLQGPIAKFQETVYSISYLSTKPSVKEGIAFPQGAWLCSQQFSTLSTTQANDGVVPSAQQVAPGQQAAGIIAGDHLDVVGHFESTKFSGVAVFRSGSGFDDARFETLWRKIAGDLTS